LFFIASVLPEPDEPFTPDLPNCLTWFAGAAFEITILSLRLVSTTSVSVKLADKDAGRLAFGLARLAILFSMTVAFWYSRRQTAETKESDAERESLLANGNGSSQEYGAAKPDVLKNNSVKVTDAQSSGWLDYLVGFKALFPYIW
jgi:hypothetical protein